MKKACAGIVVLALLAAPALADQKVDEAVAKAKEQLHKGRPEDAQKTLQKLADQNPSSPEAQMWLGWLLEQLGNFDDASARMTKATDVSASARAGVRAQVLAARANLELRIGSGHDALAHADAAVNADPSVVALAALARAQARQGDGAKALETADRAVQAGATSGAAHAARGEALVALHRGEDAAAAFKKALEVEPKLIRARVGLAQALLAQGKAADAATEARKASEEDAKLGEAFAVLGLAMLAQNPSGWNDAIAQAQQGAFLNAKSPEIQTSVGKIFEAAGNLDQASASYKRAIEVDPGYVPAQSALIYTQVRRGDLDGALALAQRIVAENPQSGDAQLQLGKVMLRKADFAGGVGALQKSATLSPNVAETHALLGTAYQRTGHKVEAAAAYKKATELAPSNTDYLTTYGLLLGMADQGAEGAAILKKVIATPGYKSADAWLNLGWVYRNMKPARTDESVDAYKRAIEIDPKNGQAALGMGWAYSYSRLWDESIQSFKKAIELDPTLAGESNNGMAWCFFFKKDMPEAKASLAKAQAAGRHDARLKENIEKIEKLLAGGKKAEEEIAKIEGPKQEQGPDIGTVAGTLMDKRKTPGARTAAVHEICGFGQPAIQYLTYSLQTDSSVDVRFAAVQCLGSMGPRAKEALPALQLALKAERTVDPLHATAEDMKNDAREEDLKRLIKEMIPKIQGK